MCGILGHFKRVGTDNSDFDRLFLDALSAIDHRGPDDKGHEIFLSQEGLLHLGHTRLAILDLSVSGHQPMHSVDGRYTIIFNGEIYNHNEIRAELQNEGVTFNGLSDTEVLLKAWIRWGINMLPRLIGMFSFAIYDSQLFKLTLVRDAFGIKPLFFYLDKQSLIFSSELKPILILKNWHLKVNQSKVEKYLAEGSQDNTKSTFFEGVNHVPPAHYVEISLSNHRDYKEIRWWAPTINEIPISFSDAAERLRSLFLDSIRMHLISDVPVGIALSGGIDSSAIACCARYLYPEKTIFTFSFIEDQKEYSEEKWIDTVNEHINAVSNKIRINKNELKGDLAALISSQGEPFATTSMYAQFKIFEKAKEMGVKVVLEGQGADEVIAGYFGYQGQRMLSLFELGSFYKMLNFARAWKGWPGRKHLSPWRSLCGQLMPVWLHKLFLPIAGKKNKSKYIAAPFSFGVRNKIINYPYLKIENDKGRRVMQALALNLSNGGLTSLLRHGDRNAMSFSIENRVPFLTIPIVDFLFSLPEEYLISQNGETKSIFRQAMRGIVPDSVLDRRDKIGFITSMSHWVLELGNDLKKLKINSDNVNNLHLRAREINKRLEELGSKDKEKFVTSEDWRLINLLMWLRISSGDYKV